MASDQALAQLASIGVTLAIAALGGTVTGLFIYHCSMNQTNPKTKLNIFLYLYIWIDSKSFMSRVGLVLKVIGWDDIELIC